MTLFGATQRETHFEAGELVSGFVKIYGKILKSSVWVGQPAHLRLTWIALLVLADKNGNVYSSVPGLAQDAGVTIPEVLQALEAFKSPDPFSRTPDNEGRRIEEIDGGWRVLNHHKYREMRTESQVKNAERQAKFKLRRKGAKAAPMTPVDARVTDVTGNTGNAPDLLSVGSVISRNDPDPDRARATPLPSGVFEAPVLPVPPAMTHKVPPWWQGPNERHRGIHAPLGVDVDHEAAKFRVHHFQVPFPATPEGVDDRFEGWLLKARTVNETERAKGRRRMAPNGVAALQPDEGRTGFEAFDEPEPEPERPRRAAGR